MTVIDEHGRPEPPVASDEVATVVGFLDYQRATFAWKTAGLGRQGLTCTVAGSAMTLGGMLKHLALVEDWWFSTWLHDNPPREPWAGVDWDTDPDWEWRTAADDAPDDLRGQWQEAVQRSRSLVADAVARAGLDQPAARQWPDGRAPSLRWILLHMLEEYARHNGHADLIRESFDGERGE